MTTTPIPGQSDDTALRNQLSSLQGLLVLSMLLTESRDEDRIINLASTSVRSLANCDLRGVFRIDEGWTATAGPCLEPDVRAEVEAQFAVMSEVGGAVGIPDEPWTWAFPLRSLAGHAGFLVVGGDAEPPTPEQFLLRVLAQQMGIALANARLHNREMTATAEAHTLNRKLAETVVAYERRAAIHDRLTRAAAAGEGSAGIAQAVHELTGYPIAVEDRHGNLQAWAGPGRVDPYPKPSAAARERLLRRAADEGGPIRDGDRLLVIASPRPDVASALVLVDPERTAGESESVALEHGATVLGMEMARLQSLAETELRLGRDLVEDLLTGAEGQTAASRAQALGYDLGQPHRVAVVVGEKAPGGDETLLEAVRRVARGPSPRVLVAPRAGAIVVIAPADHDWNSFGVAVERSMAGSSCRIGVGGICPAVDELPRSYREAVLSLRMGAVRTGGSRVAIFDQLGVYRILAEVEDTTTVDRFVREWLGALIEYDRNALRNWIDAATANGVNLSPYKAVLVVQNFGVDHGFAGNGVVIVHGTPSLCEFGFICHEMGHGMGLPHSWSANPDTEYGDGWDVMSFATTTFQFPITFQNTSGAATVGLNARNLRALQALPAGRDWQPAAADFSATITLDPLNQPPLGNHGPLVVTVPPGATKPSRPSQSSYTAEFRHKADWDQAIPEDSVSIREVRSNGLSYLQPTMWSRLKAGDQYATPDPPVYFRVTNISAAPPTATLRVWDLPDGCLRKEDSKPKVYLIENGAKRWVTSPAVLFALGKTWGDVRAVPDGALLGVPDGPDVNLLTISVTPHPVPLSRPVSVTVSATDITSGNAAQGSVIVDGATLGTTGTPFTHTFRPHRVLIPGTHPPEWDITYPTGIVRAAGYPDAPIDFGFPDI